jgi:hypothetical protein
MPPKAAKEAIAFQDSGHVDGWYYTVNAASGIANITGPKKRVPYKLTRDCPIDRAAQRAELRQHIRHLAPAWGHGDGPVEDDERAADRESEATDQHAGQDILEPATQQVDVEDDTDQDPSHRLGSPFRFSFCRGCADPDCAPALDTPDGGFFCTGCVEDDEYESEVIAAAEAQLAARTAAAAQTPPKPPPLQPRRSSRAIKPVASVYDLDRNGPGQPGWSRYDLGRLEARHDRTREESYSELQVAREKLQAEVETARRENGELAGRLDGVYSRLRALARESTSSDSSLSLSDCQAAAAVFLREAIAEIADHFERSGAEPSLERSSMEPSTATAAARPPAEVVGEVPTLPAPWSAEGVCIGIVDSARGALSLNGGYLSWEPASGLADEPWQHLQFKDVLYAEIDESEVQPRLSHHTSTTPSCTTHGLTFPYASLCRRTLSSVWSCCCTRAKGAVSNSSSRAPAAGSRCGPSANAV